MVIDAFGVRQIGRGDAHAESYSAQAGDLCGRLASRMGHRVRGWGAGNARRPVRHRPTDAAEFGFLPRFLEGSTDRPVIPFPVHEHRLDLFGQFEQRHDLGHSRSGSNRHGSYPTGF